MSYSMYSHKGETILLGDVASHLCASLLIADEPGPPLLSHLPFQVLDPLARTPCGHCPVRVTRLLEQPNARLLQDGLEEEGATGVMLVVLVDGHVAHVEFAAPAGVHVECLLDISPVELADCTANLAEGVLRAGSGLRRSGIRKEGHDAESRVGQFVGCFGEEGYHVSVDR